MGEAVPGDRTDFLNKVVVVTGGSRGIGQAVVKEFCTRGARVYFTFRGRENDAQQVMAETGAVGIQCNQRDKAAIEQAVETIMAAAGAIDVLVNNAGITDDMLVTMMPEDSWRTVLETNLDGAYRWTKAVSRPMINAGHGSIVNIASVAGLVGTAGQSAYAASKGGLMAFTRSTAAELGQKGIRVNAVVPGFIETEMTAKMPRDVKKKSVERVVLRRLGKPEEIARVVAFVASDAASYVVGQSIVVDGGLTTTVAYT